MGVLLQFLLNIFGNVAVFAVSKLGVQYGIRLTVVAVWIGLFVTLTAGMNSLLNTIHQAVPAPVQYALGMLPASTGACIATIAACKALCWVYSSSVFVLSAKARV